MSLNKEAIDLRLVSEVEVEDEAGNGEQDSDSREDDHYRRDTFVNCVYHYVHTYTIVWYANCDGGRGEGGGGLGIEGKKEEKEKREK